jgi:hypothetical protein
MEKSFYVRRGVLPNKQSFRHRMTSPQENQTQVRIQYCLTTQKVIVRQLLKEIAHTKDLPKEPPHQKWWLLTLPYKTIGPSLLPHRKDLHYHDILYKVFQLIA